MRFLIQPHRIEHKNAQLRNPCTEPLPYGHTKSVSIEISVVFIFEIKAHTVRFDFLSTVEGPISLNGQHARPTETGERDTRNGMQRK